MISPQKALAEESLRRSLREPIVGVAKSLVETYPSIASVRVNCRESPRGSETTTYDACVAFAHNNRRWEPIELAEIATWLERIVTTARECGDCMRHDQTLVVTRHATCTEDS